ncbi:MAG: hypothetical protein K9J28_09105 [Sulfuritalea sp.]|nr:hypothetical protein [Sulfuritalea sp.]
MISEVWLLAVFAGVIIIPRFLLRFKLPLPLSGLALGALMTYFGYELVGDDRWALLATLGITSLFLFAGLEINLKEIEQEKSRLIQHIAIKLLMLAGLTFLINYHYPVQLSVAVLLSLAIITPSAGFILSTIKGLNLNNDEQFWVSNKAILAEIIALCVMFVPLQSDASQVGGLGVLNNFLTLLGLIVALPLIFTFLGKVITPYAEGSEFSFLIMMGLIAGYITKSIGVYYLIGAFMVGFIAVLLKKRMPLIASDANLEAIRLFTTFFIPFYFFVSGSRLPMEVFSETSFFIGLLILMMALPIRWFIVWLQRRISNVESSISSFRVAVALTPTLIFTMVIGEILFTRNQISVEIFGGLVMYAILNTLLPTIVFALMKKEK